MDTLPEKTRELHNHHFDSTVWNDFKFRDDDIVIGTYAKSGTTWVQQIVGQLIFDGKEGVPVAEISPWIDLRVPPKEEKKPSKNGCWNLPNIGESHAVEQASAMSDRYNRMFIRTLRALRDLRRHWSTVVVQNAGQVNVGEQQVNVS